MQQKRPIMILIFAMLLSLLFTGVVMAETNSDSVIDYSKKGALFIEYKDTVDGTDPVVGAVFTVYKVADLNFMGDYTSQIPSMPVINNESNEEEVLAAAKKAYTEKSVTGEGYTVSATTDASGAKIQELPFGLYVVEESSPAPSHYASEPFLLPLPYTNDGGNTWLYEITANPKPHPLGDLVVSKEVTGSGGDMNRDFHFVVTLEKYEETVPYKKSTGEEGTIKSGDSVALKSGQTATIQNIPAGTAYSVKEVEENQDGYVTTYDGAEGNIRKATENKAAFYNSKRSAVDTGDTDIPILCLIIVGIAGIVIVLLTDGIKKINKKMDAQ